VEWTHLAQDNDHGDELWGSIKGGEIS
jgi:hypothetical protein